MAFLLRVELPDVPGSLGRLASTTGEAGGDIEAIEIVEHRSDGTAVDDVLLDMAPGMMPDSVVSAIAALDGVRVLFVSRYAAGGNLLLDLEAVEELTVHASDALLRIVDLLPATFRADWAARVRRNGDTAEVVHATAAAPDEIQWHDVERAAVVESYDDNNIVAAAPLVPGEIILLGRRGGPEILDSELARLSHLIGLAVSIFGSA